MLEVLRGLLALGLTDRQQDTGLGDAAEIVLDGRRPPRRGNVEAGGIRNAVSVGKRAQASVPGLMD